MTRSRRVIRPLCLSVGVGALATASATLWAAAPTAAAAPAKDSFIGEMLAIVLPMVFIIAGLLFVLRILRRRYGLAGRDAPLSVLQILPIGPRERVVLLQSRAGRVFAIGVAAHNVTFITDLEPEDVAQTPESALEAASRSRTNIVGDR